MKKVLLGLLAVSALAMGAPEQVNVETKATINNAGGIIIDLGANGDAVVLDHGDITNTATNANSRKASAMIRIGRKATSDSTELSDLPVGTELNFTLVADGTKGNNLMSGEAAMAHTLTAQIGGSTDVSFGTSAPKITLTGDNPSAEFTAVQLGEVNSSFSGGIAGVVFESIIAGSETTNKITGTYTNNSRLDITIVTM